VLAGHSPEDWPHFPRVRMKFVSIQENGNEV
jgi:hypothetical protein